MNLRDIREECWDIARETADNDYDRLWSTKEMNRYINRVYRFIARETKCIRDSSDTNTALCMLASTVVPYTSWVPADGLNYIWANDPSSWLYQKNVTPYVYALSPLILQVDECKWTIRQWKLLNVSVSKWQTNPWWEQVLGMPTEFALDLANNTLALNFRSETSDTLRLQVRRMPLTDLVADTDIPEFRTHYHDFMVNGVLAQMYQKQDSQAFDAVKSLDFQGRFLVDVNEIKQQETILTNRLRPNHSTDAFR